MAKTEPSAQHKRIFKVMCYSRDDPATKGGILRGEAIEHENQLWLVPLWLDSKVEAWSMPARLICLSAPPLAAHLEESNLPDTDYLLNYPIPIADLQNVTPPETDHGFVVIERPSLKIVRPH